MASEPVELTTEDFNTGRYVVRGALGVPLGHAVEVTARIVAGKNVNRLWEGDYCLEIETVSGRPLKDRPILRFVGLTVGIPANRFELAEKLTGKEVDSLQQEERDKLDKYYVGTKKRLVVVEYGEFTGVPIGGTPRNSLKFSGARFAFATHLLLVAERSEDPPNSTNSGG